MMSFVFNDEEMCIKNEELCIKNDECRSPCLHLHHRPPGGAKTKNIVFKTRNCVPESHKNEKSLLKMMNFAVREPGATGKV